MPKPVHALVGDDSFLQLSAVKAIRAQLPGAQEVQFDGDHATLAEVLDELRSFSMFGSGKLVIIRSGDEFISQFRESLEDYLQHPADGVLVLRCQTLPKNQRIYKLIAKIGTIEECEPPKPAVLPKWIADRAKQVHKLTVDPQAALLLADLIGNDLGRLDNELAKLALQVEGNKLLPDDVHEGVSFQREQEMWDMTNELAVGQTTEALRRWRRLVQLDSSAEFRAVTWLTMWLEEVGNILTGGNTSKLTWKYRDRLPKVIQTAKSFGLIKHAQAVDLLANLDRRSKSGLGEAVQNIERFILSLA